MSRVNLEEFPCIKQEREDWCIPASIENIIKYHSGSISQKDIVDMFIKKFGSEQIHFGNVKEILEEKYGDNYRYILKSKGQDDFKNGEDVIDYAEKCLEDNWPLIIAMKNLPNSSAVHMYVVVNIEGEEITVYDTDPSITEYLKKDKNWIIEHLTDGLGTFLIISK